MGLEPASELAGEAAAARTAISHLLAPAGRESERWTSRSIKKTQLNYFLHFSTVRNCGKMRIICREERFIEAIYCTPMLLHLGPQKKRESADDVG